MSACMQHKYIGVCVYSFVLRKKLVLIGSFVCTQVIKLYLKGESFEHDNNN